MACRKIVADKHRRAVALMLDGMSPYRALRAAGYSHYSARCPRLVFKHSWALRQALIEAQEERQHYLRPHPPRRKRYDRRTLALTAETYCQREFQESTTAAGIRLYDQSAKTAKRIAAGLPLRPVRCSRCGGPLEGQDRWCPNCRRSEFREGTTSAAARTALPQPKPQRFLVCPLCHARTEEKDMRYTIESYVCSKCARC